MAAWLQAEWLISRWNLCEDDALMSSSQRASPGSDTFPALWPTFCLSLQLTEHWMKKKTYLDTLMTQTNSSSHSMNSSNPHKRTISDDESRPGWVTHFTQQLDGLCNTTESFTDTANCPSSSRERWWDDTTFVLISFSLTITNRHETCCRLQERILNTPLLYMIWLKQHTSHDFIKTLLFHSSEHIRLIWLVHYRSVQRQLLENGLNSLIPKIFVLWTKQGRNTDRSPH